VDDLAEDRIAFGKAKGVLYLREKLCSLSARRITDENDEVIRFVIGEPSLQLDLADRPRWKGRAAALREHQDHERRLNLVFEPLTTTTSRKRITELFRHSLEVCPEPFGECC